MHKDRNRSIFMMLPSAPCSLLIIGPSCSLPVLLLAPCSSLLLPPAPSCSLLLPAPVCFLLGDRLLSLTQSNLAQRGAPMEYFFIDATNTCLIVCSSFVGRQVTETNVRAAGMLCSSSAIAMLCSSGAGRHTANTIRPQTIRAFI